jgi:ribosomal protein S18 acetylase RimI-like enzyme
MNQEIIIQHYTVDFDKSTAIVIAALHDGNFIGSCNCGIGKNVISVYNFSVHESYKGKGVAQEMLKFIIETGKEIKKQSISMTVFKDNAAAYGCYYKAGFRIIKEEDDMYLMGYQL